jgi:predicted TIM-barrel fold metal-dependent hydrolase
VINGLKIVDVDRRVVEPPDIWEKYVEIAFRDRVPTWDAGALRVPVLAGKAMVRGGEAIARAVGPGPRERFSEAHAAGFTAASNLADMDREGIDVAVLSPSAGLYAFWADEVPADLAAALSRAYNNWLADYCRAAPDRLKGLALLPLHDPEAAAAELRRGVGELGMVGGVIRSNPLPDRQLEVPEYDPIYAVAAELDVPIAVAGGPGSRLPEIGVESQAMVRFDNPFARAAISGMFEQLGATLSLAGKAVFERHPGLRAVFLDGGATWAPWWLDRMDEHWENAAFGRDAPGRFKPSDDFRRGGFVVARSHEGALPETVAALGAENLLWGSSYPRAELTDFPDEARNFLARADLPGEAKRRILWDNPARLFRLG